jgi:hypothetical protein
MTESANRMEKVEQKQISLKLGLANVEARMRYIALQDPTDN